MRKRIGLTQEWTTELFERHPELYIEEFERRIPQASDEIKTLLEYLKKHGFRPKRILDLNCGIGRHSIELAKRGIKVFGTDISPYYIKVAKKRAKKEGVNDKTYFRVVDMRKIASILQNESPFDGIVNLWTSFGYYDKDTNNDILQQCLKLVGVGGFFVLEIINRDWLVGNFQERDFIRSKKRIILEKKRFDLNNSRLYAVRTYFRWKNRSTLIFEKEIVIDHRVWGLNELIKLFQKNGWQFKAAYSGMTRQRDCVPLTNTKRLLLIMEKR